MIFLDYTFSEAVSNALNGGDTAFQGKVLHNIYRPLDILMQDQKSGIQLKVYNRSEA